MEPTHHATTELVMGLDFQTVDRALDLVDRLPGVEVIYQVGLDLFMNGGPELLRELAHRKKRVFLDLKFLDSPTSVVKAVQQAALYHVEALSLQLAGGSGMIRAVKQSLEEIPLLRPRLLGVGVLESFTDVGWAEVTRALSGHALNLSDSFESLLNCAFVWGFDGVVCQPTELERVRNLYPNLYTLVSLGCYKKSIEFIEFQTTSFVRARELGADAVLISGSSVLECRPKKDLPEVLSGLGVWHHQV
jgi:orotidine-5'-phosphate decarboxylase